MALHSETALALFENAFKTYPDRVAYTSLGHSLTFRQIDEMSAAFAAYLHHKVGLARGERIALQMPNIAQYPIAIYGALRAGLVIVNVNPLYTKRELKHQLNDSGAKALVVLSNVAAEVAQVIDETSVQTVIVTNIADFMPWPKRSLINCVVKYVKKMVPEFSFKHSVSFLEVLKVGATLACPEPEAQPDDLMLLQYTGGTTGVAKGAMLTQHNMYSNAEQIIAHMHQFFSESVETFVAPLPLYHIYAFNLHVVAGFSRGARSLLIPNPRDLDAFMKVLASETFTVFIGINTLFNAMLQHPKFKELNFSSLKVTAAGGMALTSETARKWKEVTKTAVSEGYGLTETCPVVSANPIDNIQVGTIGTLVPNTEAKIVDEQGNELGRNEPGELWIRGPQVMKGYWQRPEATAEVLNDEGWFATGDMALIQDDGYLKIVDRKKDMIIVSGFNVYPNEVEDVAMMHPSIIEAAVVGVKKETGGEIVKIFVVRSDESLTEADVIAHCRENLTAYKVPKVVEFRKDLPKSNVGKILRRELRDQ